MIDPRCTLEDAQFESGNTSKQRCSNSMEGVDLRQVLSRLDFTFIEAGRASCKWYHTAYVVDFNEVIAK